MNKHITKRPKYSLPGFRRRMQMSQAQLFIFIEGYKDRYFYSKIAETECKKLNLSYQIESSEEIPELGCGKEALLKLHDSLKRRAFLIDNFKGKTTVSIFFLDKDIDDLLRTNRHSEHIIYTKTYELENYLFIYGELGEAAASSASLEPQKMRTGLGDYTEWRKRAAANWKEWVKLCLFSRCHSKKGRCYYGRPRSHINDGIAGPLNDQKYTYHKSCLQCSSGLTPEAFDSTFTRWSKKVDDLYTEDLYDLVFKGKWYVCFLVNDIKKIAGTRRFNKQYIETSLLNNLAQTLNFEDGWTDHFRTPIRNLLTRVKI